MHLFGRISLGFLTLSSARCWQLTPNDPYPTLVSKLQLTPAMIEEMGGSDYVQAALANATLPGKSRSPRRRGSEHGLEVRQGTTNNETCSNPAFVLVCPITEQDPCCDPAYPICCHDPSNTCCPTGTFCQGLQTCCLNGAVGCGEGCCQANIPCCNNVCCPSSTYICDTSTSAGTCVNTATSNGATQASTQGQETASHNSAALPTNTETGSKKSNNTAIIGGAVGGGVVALILIALLAWWILKRNPSQPTPVNNLNGTNAGKTSLAPPTNYSNVGTGGTPLMSSTPSAYHHSNGTPLSFATHTQATTSSPPPGTINTTSAGRPFSVPSFVGPPGGGLGPGMGALAAGGGLVAGGMAAEAMHDQPAAGHGGLNYVPPPAENNPAGANYYANTPVPHLGGGGSGYGGPGSTAYGGNASTYAPSTITSPLSRQMSSASGAPLMPMSAVGVADERPPWLGGPSPSQSPAPSHGATTSYTPPPSTYSPPPPGAAPAQFQPGQPNFGMNQPTHHGLMSPPPGVMTPPPGVMSPPPPFSPAPGGGLGDAPGSGGSRPGYTPWAIPGNAGDAPPPGEFGGAGGSDGMGRTVPMTAPADSKATFSGAGGYH